MSTHNIYVDPEIKKTIMGIPRLIRGYARVSEKKQFNRWLEYGWQVITTAQVNLNIWTGLLSRSMQ